MAPLCVLLVFLARLSGHAGAQGELQKPVVSVEISKIFSEGRVFITCETPSSVNVTSCNLYSGDTQQPHRSVKSRRKSCVFDESVSDLSSEVSCDYSVGTDPSTLSPRSDRYIIPGHSQRPGISVSQSQIPKGSSVTVTCEAPESVKETSCELYRHTDPSVFMTLKVSGNECHFTVTGTELLRELRPTGLYTDIDLSCEYRDSVSRSQRSNRTTVQVLDIPKPELRVSPAVVRETDSVELSCEGPQSVSVSHCSFYTEGERLNESHPACRRTLTGARLATGGRRSAVRRVNVTCQYTAKTDYSESPSPHSDPATVTVMESCFASRFSTGELSKPTASVTPETVSIRDTVQRGERGDQSLMWKIGVAAGLFLLVGVMVIGLWFWRKRKNSKGRSASSDVPADSPYALVMTPGSSNNTAAQDVTYCTIPDLPSPAAHRPVQAGQDITYSTISDLPSPAAHRPVQAGQDITYSTISDLPSSTS